MKRFLLFIALVLSCNAFGQVTITTVSSCSAYTLTGTFVGTAPTNIGLYSDDSYSGVLNIGFTFDFYGTAHTQLVVGENGMVTFTPSLAGGYDPWPISAALLGNSSALNSICGPWCDIEGSIATQPIYVSLQGTAPNRSYAVTWCGIYMYDCTTQWTTTQIVLYETSNIINVNIGHKTICAAWNGGYAITGVQNAAGSAATTAPGENYPSTWTATNQAWSFTPVGGTSYTVASIPYAPIPYASSAIYWYDSATHTYLGTGATVVVTPSVTTTYEAVVLGCNDSVKSFITVPGLGSGAGGGGGTAAITGNASICLGSTTQLSDVTTGGTWSSSNTLVATINSTGFVTSVAGGVTTITYSTGTCYSLLAVTVNTVSAVTGATICEGGTATLTDAVTGGTWTSSNTGVATIGLTTGVVNGISPGNTNITYVTAAGCSATTTVNVFVLNAIGGIKTVCQGLTTSLSDVSPGGAWSSGSPGVASIVAGTGIVTGVTGGTANITYSTGGGCYITTVVTVNPVSPITGTLDMCQYFTTVLGDALPGGSWTSNATGIATVSSSTGVVTGVTAGNAVISYTLPTGCIMTTDVTVHPKPAPPAPTPQKYCSNDIPTNVAATPTTGLTWYGPGVTPPMTAPPTPTTPLTAGTITYYVTETSAFGCVSDSAADNVIVIAQPNPPVTSNTSYCQYSTVLPLNSQVDSSSASYLTWFALSTGGSPLAGVPTVNDSSVTYPGANTFYVAQTVNGCISNRAPVSVTIVYKPSFTITASQNWVCDHDTLTFAYNSIAPLLEGSYLWQLPVGTTVVEGSDTSSVIAVKFDSVYGQHTVYLTVGELNNMCSTQNSVQVSVIALPTATSYMNPNICIGDTVSLALSSESSDASVFGWYIDGIPMTNSGAINIVAANSNSGGPYSLRWNDTGTHIITVTTTTTQGCKSLPTNDTVNVHALPNATFTYKSKSSDVLCLEDSVQFIANNISENDSYLWQPAHSFNNDNKAVIWGKVEETQSDITLTVTDPFGCVGMSTQQLDPSACCTVLFPNAFTPNGDGKNDVFRPLFNGYHNFHFFRIVNRWGETIFESSNSLPAWDGTFNGVAQDIGTYYYFIQYDCGGNAVEEKGDVTLIR